MQAGRALPQSLQHSLQAAELGVQTGQTGTACSGRTVLQADQAKELADGSTSTIPKTIQVAHGGYEAAKL